MEAVGRWGGSLIIAVGKARDDAGGAHAFPYTADTNLHCFIMCHGTRGTGFVAGFEGRNPLLQLAGGDIGTHRGGDGGGGAVGR
jgi:hypothetical protein